MAAGARGEPPLGDVGISGAAGSPSAVARTGRGRSSGRSGPRRRAGAAAARACSAGRRTRSRSTSMIDSEVSRPMRSSRASGPMGSPMPAVAAASMSSRLAKPVSSRVDGVVQVGQQQRVGHEPGPVADLHRGLAEPPSQRRRPVGGTPASVSTVATTSTSRITGAGLKKCRPTTRPGWRGRRGDRGHRQRGGVGGQDGVRPADTVQLGEDRALELQPLGHGLDGQVGPGRLGQAAGWP